MELLLTRLLFVSNNLRCIGHPMRQSVDRSVPINFECWYHINIYVYVTWHTSGWTSGLMLVVLSPFRGDPIQMCSRFSSLVVFVVIY